MLNVVKAPTFKMSMLQRNCNSITTPSFPIGSIQIRAANKTGFYWAHQMRFTYLQMCALQKFRSTVAHIAFE